MHDYVDVGVAAAVKGVGACAGCASESVGGSEYVSVSSGVDGSVWCAADYAGDGCWCDIGSLRDASESGLSVYPVLTVMEQSPCPSNYQSRIMDSDPAL